MTCAVQAALSVVMLPLRFSDCDTYCASMSATSSLFLCAVFPPTATGFGPCLQVPIDPIAKLPGLLDALKLMDAAVQQNTYHEKLLMYRNVRMPDQDKVLSCFQLVPGGHCLAELPVGRCMLSCAAAPYHATFHCVPLLYMCMHACITAELKLVPSWCIPNTCLCAVPAMEAHRLILQV